MDIVTTSSIFNVGKAELMVIFVNLQTGFPAALVLCHLSGCSPAQSGAGRPQASLTVTLTAAR